MSGLSSWLTKRPRRDLAALLRIPGTYRNWWSVYGQFRAIQGFSRGIRGPVVRLSLRDGAEFDVRSGTIDVEIVHDVYVREEYAAPSCRLEPSDTVVIDIGAHIGAFAVFAGHRLPQATILALEPEPENFQLLRRNLALNRLSRAVPVQAAVGGQRGTATLYLSPNRSCDYTLDYRPGPHLSVPVVTLADLFATHRLSHCDFLKIDCEGAEFSILYQSPPSLFARIRKVALEYHHHPEEIALLRPFFTGLGYTVVLKPAPSPNLGKLFAWRG